MARTATPNASLEFAPGQASVLEIRYTANSFEEAGKVRFQYRLLGHDKDWQEAGDRRVTHYTNLDPGRYEFRIRACNNHGVWGPVSEDLAFVVAPYFHQTWWFATLCILAAIALAAAVQSYRLNIQRRLLQLENQNALEKERGRIAKDMHDDLGARLTQLGLISELAESPHFQPSGATSNTLPKVSTLARETVRSLDEIVWAVSPGKNSLDQLAGYLTHAAQDLIRPSGIRLELKFPDHIPQHPLSPELRHNVFLVCKEFINNSIKHSRGSLLRIGFRYSPTHGHITIEDDGQGFDIDSAATRGNGLSNMRKRAESVNADFQLHSTPGKGSRIEIQFPLRKEPS